MAKKESYEAPSLELISILIEKCIADLSNVGIESLDTDDEEIGY